MSATIEQHRFNIEKSLDGTADVEAEKLLAMTDVDGTLSASPKTMAVVSRRNFRLRYDVSSGGEGLFGSLLFSCRTAPCVAVNPKIASGLTSLTDVTINADTDSDQRTGQVLL
jgi:hypothetical protein